MCELRIHSFLHSLQLFNFDFFFQWKLWPQKSFNDHNWQSEWGPRHAVLYGTRNVGQKLFLIRQWYVGSGVHLVRTVYAQGTVLVCQGKTASPAPENSARNLFSVSIWKVYGRIDSIHKSCDLPTHRCWQGRQVQPETGGTVFVDDKTRSQATSHHSWCNYKRSDC